MVATSVVEMPDGIIISEYRCSIIKGAFHGPLS
jgi:hypothetical protein